MAEHTTPSRGPIVVPSVDLDAHLHEQAAGITKRRYSKNSVKSADAPAGKFSNHDDELMTPPDILLERGLDECIEFAKSNAEGVLEGWIRCTALARIVHGDSHWILAKTHIQLGVVYLKKGLSEQALMHASKGRNILLLPGSHMMSHDQSPEAVYNLSVAHCVIGQVLISQTKLKEAERSLLKAEKSSERYSKLPGGDTDTQLDLDIISAMGKLCLEQRKYILAKDCFQKAVDLCKAGFGPKNKQLVGLLRGLASAHLKADPDGRAAVEALEEALKLAESSFGPTSEEVGNTLVSLGRAHTAGGAAEAVEDYLRRAYSVFSSLYDQYHERTISCKNELCHFLATRKDSQKRVIPLLKELISEKKIAYGDNSIEVGESLKLLGTVYLTQGEVKQAANTLEKAKVAYSSERGVKDKETLSITKTLDMITGSVSTCSRTKDVKPRFKTVV